MKRKGGNKMVKKTENLMSQLDFRPVSTFQRYQGEDFGKTMQAATRTSTKKDTSSAYPTKAETGKQSTTTDKGKAVNKALEKMNQSAKKDVLQTEEKEMPEEDVMAMLQTAIAEIKQQFVDVFGVTDQELAAAMEKLGLTEEDLSDPELLTKLAEIGRAHV